MRIDKPDYVVQPKDTMWHVAAALVKERGGTVNDTAIANALKELEKLNPGLFTAERKKGDRIFPGDQVRFPEKEGGWKFGASTRPAAPQGDAAADMDRLKAEADAQKQRMRDTHEQTLIRHADFASKNELTASQKDAVLDHLKTVEAEAPDMLDFPHVRDLAERVGFKRSDAAEEAAPAAAPAATPVPAEVPAAKPPAEPAAPVVAAGPAPDAGKVQQATFDLEGVALRLRQAIRGEGRAPTNASLSFLDTVRKRDPAAFSAAMKQQPAELREFWNQGLAQRAFGSFLSERGIDFGDAKLHVAGKEAFVDVLKSRDDLLKEAKSITMPESLKSSADWKSLGNGSFWRGQNALEVLHHEGKTYLRLPNGGSFRDKYYQLPGTEMARHKLDVAFE